MKKQKHAETGLLPRRPHRKAQVNKAPRLRYVTDEFGNVGPDPSLWVELDELPTESITRLPTVEFSSQTQQTTSTKPQHFNDSVTDVNSIPESKPAGFLDLNHLPPIPPVLVYPRQQSTARKPKDRKNVLAWPAPKRTAKRPQTRRGKSRSDLEKCPHCAAMVKPSRLQGHIEKVHAQAVKQPAKRPTSSDKTVLNDLAKLVDHLPNSVPSASEQTPELTTCPVCNVAVKHSRLMRHLRKVHGQSLQATAAALPKQAVRTPKATKAGKRQPVYEIDTRKSPPAFEQAAYEARFGDKYVGYMQREQGRWGSIPLYDDYGHDSDAE